MPPWMIENTDPRAHVLECPLIMDDEWGDGIPGTELPPEFKLRPVNHWTSHPLRPEDGHVRPLMGDETTPHFEDEWQAIRAVIYRPDEDRYGPLVTWDMEPAPVTMRTLEAAKVFLLKECRNAIKTEREQSNGT